MRKTSCPTCTEKKKDCFAFCDGKCTVLQSPYTNKKCPFYKPKKEVEECKTNTNTTGI